MKIVGYKCPKCKDIVYSRARHDLRQCTCENIYVDGGFDYIRLGSYDNKRPESVELEIDVTKEELYKDWSYGVDNYGVIREEEEDI